MKDTFFKILVLVEKGIGLFITMFVTTLVVGGGIWLGVIVLKNIFQ